MVTVYVGGRGRKPWYGMRGVEIMANWGAAGACAT